MRRRFLSGDSYFPPRRAWPLIRSRTKSGDLLFHGYNKNNINRPLKSTLMKMNVPNAHRYTSKAFRRGTTQEIRQSGWTIDVIKSSGAWLGNGFRSYVSFEFNRSRQISRLLIALGDSSSDDEEPHPKTKVARTQRSAELPSAIADPPESDSSPPQKLHQ